MSKPESFEWHGYRFEMIDFDVNAGVVGDWPPEIVEVWQVTRFGKFVSVGGWTSDVNEAKAGLLQTIQSEAIELKRRAKEVSAVAKAMLADLHG